MRYHQVSEGRAVGLDGLVLIGAIALVRQLVVIHKHRNQLEVQRSELVASVSHELRTPLTAIVGYLAILEEDDYLSEDVQREMLADASDQARHMARLVSDVMLLAKGLDNLVPLEITTTTVSELIRDALTGVPEASIDVDVDDSTVRVDGDRIRQALVNMLTNANKYGGGRILVRARARHERTPGSRGPRQWQGCPDAVRELDLEPVRTGGQPPRLLDARHGHRPCHPARGGGIPRRVGVLPAFRGPGGACFTLMIPGGVIARSVKLRV